MTSQSNKVYISNLNYHTTEDELREYLAGTKADNVFMPNYFIGLGTLRFKPLGIAYADFPTAEDAESFMKEFEGKQFKDRKLKIKLHVPFTPSQKPTRRSSVNSIKRLASRNGHDDSKRENKENVGGDGARPSGEKKYSPNSLFVKGLKGKNCEDDLKELFKDFNPTEIRIFKPRGWMRGLKNFSHNAIITFDLPGDKSLDDAIATYSGAKCCGNTIVVLRAFQNAGREGDEKAEQPQADVPEPGANEGLQASDPADMACVLVGDTSGAPANADGTSERPDPENVSAKAIFEVSDAPEEQAPVVEVNA